jgi:hypothetical protein
MVTVVSNPHRFHLVHVLSKDQKCTSRFYIDHIFSELGALRDARDRRKFVTHADNAKPQVTKSVKHYLDENGLRSAPHPPFPPDLALSDFFSSVMSKEYSESQNFRLQKSFLRR